MSGFWQIRMEPEDEEKTAFVTRFGSYQYRVLPMGLNNSPSTFQRVMTNVLGDMIDDFVLVYLDDFAVFSNDHNQHQEHLRRVFQALREANLYLNTKKCVIGQDSITFLGHQVSKNHLGVEEAKIAALKEWHMPRTRTELGFLNFYRGFLKDFARIATPLTNLLCTSDKQPTASLQIGQKERTAFNVLRDKLTHAPVLIMPHEGVPFVLTTDASDTAVGAVLEQDITGKGMQPVAFFSKRLSTADANYHPRDLELLAQVVAMEHWRTYLLGNKFTLRTDHQSLITLDSQELKSGRVARWAERMSAYEYVVEYIRGADNRADALSRPTTDGKELTHKGHDTDQESQAQPVGVTHTWSAALDMDNEAQLAELRTANYFKDIMAALEHPETTA